MDGSEFRVARRAARDRSTDFTPIRGRLQPRARDAAAEPGRRRECDRPAIQRAGFFAAAPFGLVAPGPLRRTRHEQRVNDPLDALATMTAAGAAIVWTALTVPSLVYLWRTRLPEALRLRAACDAVAATRHAACSAAASRTSGLGPPRDEPFAQPPEAFGPPSRAKLELRSGWPKVSVIVAARDEAARVADCLRSILASDYPDFELIAVDDRSTDGTARRMDEVAAEDPRCRVVHVTELPEGWLGKCWALHCGAGAAGGRWLLFCDGDVLLAPDALRVAIAEATRCGLDHLALMPGLAGASTYAESCLLTAFGWILVAGTQPWAIPLRGSPFFAGVGAFNLVRRDTYLRFGGHAALRLHVVDDMELGRRVKSVGGRSAIRMARSLVRVRWQDSAWQIIRGLEKNAFASLGFSWLKLLVATLLFVALTWGPYLTVTAAACATAARTADVGAPDRPPGWPASNEHAVPAGRPAAAGQMAVWLAALAIPHVLFGLCGVLFGMGWRVAVAFPFALSAIVFAFWRSAWLTARQGGIRWRDTFYPLAELKRQRAAP